MINAPEVWAQAYTGQGVVAAVVIGYRVDSTHPDFQARSDHSAVVFRQWCIDDDGNGYA
jgi:hypothetical protein